MDEVVELGVGRVNAAELDDAGAHVGGELIAEGAAGYADDGKLFGQQADLLEVEERGEELALGEIAGSAKDDHDARVGDSLGTVGDLGKVFGADTHFYGCHFARLRLAWLVVSCEWSVVS